jgi:ribosomal protein S18 acetylase RimI-like enzyme
MIEKLQNTNLEVAEKIRDIFQVSYKVEAKLLNALDFPPLKRPIEEYVNCSNQFFGFLKENELAAVVEIIHNDEFTHIRSLVVDPRFFKQGIASKLMEFVLNKFKTPLFVVETGVDNGPASALYKKFDFNEVKQWDTDHGVRKVKFERIMSNER